MKKVLFKSTKKRLTVVSALFKCDKVVEQAIVNIYKPSSGNFERYLLIRPPLTDN